MMGEELRASARPGAQPIYEQITDRQTHGRLRSTVYTMYNIYDIYNVQYIQYITFIQYINRLQTDQMSECT